MVLKGTRLPRLRPLLHESAELAGGRFEAAKQSAMRKTEKRGSGVHCWTTCLGALMVLAMVHARSTARPADRSGRKLWAPYVVPCTASVWMGAECRLRRDNGAFK